MAVTSGSLVLVLLAWTHIIGGLSAESLFACDFESDICGMRQATHDNVDWVRTNVPTASADTGPYHAARGQCYIYFETSDPLLPGRTTEIQTPSIRHEGVVCLKFAYHMYGSHMGSLAVVVDTNRVFMVSADQGSQWNYVEREFDFSADDDHQVRWIATKGRGYKSDIAIDDIVLRTGACVSTPTSHTSSPATSQTSTSTTRSTTLPPAPARSLFECNFESNTCGLEAYSGGVGRWRKVTSSRGPNTGPRCAHSGRTYMYLDASRLRAREDAIVTTPSINYTGLACVEFHYHMNGPGMGSLRMNLQPMKHDTFAQGWVVWSTSGDQGDVWKYHQKEIRLTSNQNKIAWTAIRGATWRSDMGLDTISVHAGSCNTIKHCASDSVKCPEGGCIYSTWVCDGYVDCSDGWDETNCATVCRSGSSKCSDGLCIPQAWFCDGEYDCFDKSDEPSSCRHRQCPRSGSWMCSNGNCIPQDWVCDGTYDCLDHSDESHFDCHKCGISKYSLITPMIIGGTFARPHEFPWQVSLRNNPTNSHYCGGVIISETLILTAAHCAQQSNGALRDFQVVVGDHSITDDGEAYQMYHRKSRVHINPGYESRTLANDLAVVVLRDPIQFNDNVGPACLPSSSDSSVGKEVIITGWGTTNYSFSQSSDVLKWARLKIVTRDSCTTQYGIENPGVLCVSDGRDGMRGGPCNGDSGGPMILKRNDTDSWRVVGIASYVYPGCVRGKPAGYTNVAYYLNWIRTFLPRV